MLWSNEIRNLLNIFTGFQGLQTRVGTLSWLDKITQCRMIAIIQSIQTLKKLAVNTLFKFNWIQDINFFGMQN